MKYCVSSTTARLFVLILGLVGAIVVAVPLTYLLLGLTSIGIYGVSWDGLFSYLTHLSWVSMLAGVALASVFAARAWFEHRLRSLP